MNKINRKEYSHIDSDYKSGKVFLNDKELRTLSKISTTLNRTSNNYNNFPNIYSFQGIIDALQKQVDTKVDRNSVTQNEAREARYLIAMLKCLHKEQL